jgi:hypothetical protein
LSPSTQQKDKQKKSDTASTSKGNISSKTKNGAYKILAAQKDAVTRVAEAIMPEAIDNLEDKLGGDIHHPEVHPL